ncbi:Kinase superfamily protein isoform 1 [Tripterygium wilfordii]|uniref:Kinase superfamily protein isoform 1 n=1 Tax=Tripterygium wilfordii TaxID=458696 RepID=A0A7J7CEF3_TRIWF|nr:uncharacterized protein LOC119983497 [Tripterygium wilfordii]KAF5732315.1 Kinase superfamily protein isoform 1 [Tripterygium wilfordii]
MVDNKGDTTKKQPPPQPQQLSSSSPKDPLEDSSKEIVTKTSHHHHHQQPVVVAGGAPFIPSAPLYIPIGATTSPFEQQFETPKRQRFTTTGQWKSLPSPSSQQKQQSQLASESTPSPTPNPQNQQLMTTPTVVAASSSDTASSPLNSPIPSLSTSKQEGERVIHHQFRKGKYVSPVWKPNEMLWLARAWKAQYQGGSGSSSSRPADQTPGSALEVSTVQTARGKTRADKDREVAEFLNRHGINRDAKTAGTKWDNMLGEFRKVYEWETGGEREQVGKSYFRLSPYERKLHRLPASFDEEVFEELSQFMGPRIRTGTSSHSRGALMNIVGSGPSGGSDDSRTPFVTGIRALPPPPTFKDEDLIPLSVRSKQLVMTSGGEGLFHGGRGGLLGFESGGEVGGGVRRIGKIRMTWEESVCLWAEEGEHHRGRVRLQGSSFLNADELAFLDDSMVACTMEAFEDGFLKGLSVDRFLPGQQVKVFGRRKSSTSTSLASSGFGTERFQLPLSETSIRPISPWESQDPTEYYVGCLRVPPTTLTNLFELSWYLQEPPPEELRFPLRKDVYKELPQGKELFFTTSTELLDCRAITYDILSPIIRTNSSISASTATCRDSFVGVWDDCVNRIISKFCSVEMVIIRKPTFSSSAEILQDQWPNVTGFVRNFCLWRGEETDQVREGQVDPASSIVEKLLWTYMDLPYILGYYAVGNLVTFCALSRSHDRIIRTDLYSLDLSSPAERLKALIPCYRIAGLLPLLGDRCFNMSNGNIVGNVRLPYSDFERIDLGNGNLMEMTPNTVTRYFSSRRKFAAVKEIYDFLDQRVPHAEFIYRSLDNESALVFKPRGCKFKPSSFEQLVEALKSVTKALVALHDLSFMHRDLSWDKVMRRSDRENEWFVCGFDEAVCAPQLYPHGGGVEARGKHPPEMGRGLHGVKVDVWGVGHLVKTCGLGPCSVPKMLRELQNRCLDQNPEMRPTAADCYHHLLQLQSASAGVAY